MELTLPFKTPLPLPELALVQSISQMAPALIFERRHFAGCFVVAYILNKAFLSLFVRRPRRLQEER